MQTKEPEAQNDKDKPIQSSEREVDYEETEVYTLEVEDK